MKNGGIKMYEQEIENVLQAAEKKHLFLKNNPLGYFLSSMLAGMFVGVSIILIYTIGGLLNGADSTRIIMGICFGVSLSLVVFAGSELFTGNHFVMSIGSFHGRVRWVDTLKIWVVCFFGNLAGSILVAYLYHLTGLANGQVGSFILSVSQSKMSASFITLFTRGILCNILVCVAVWCTYRCKEEVAKLILIFWCLFVFITSGFEHSVANMSLLAIALFTELSDSISIMGYLYNIIVVSFGNLIGGTLFMAIPYYLIGLQKKQ